MAPVTAARTAKEIETRLASLAATYPECTKTFFPNRTFETDVSPQASPPNPTPSAAGRQISFIKIAKGAGTRPGVFLMGGIHGREMAPPDALLSFAENLLEAYKAKAAIRYPGLRYKDPNVDLRLMDFSIDWPTVQAIVEKIDLYIAPLINPDGRDYDIKWPVADPGKGWRKNRRPPMVAGQEAGVDANRNFDICWKYEDYYDAAAGVTPASSGNPNDETFRGHGPGAATEPETQNVQWLLTNNPIHFFVDIHSCAGKILYPWNIEDNGTTKTGWTGSGVWNKADGGGGAYREYFDDPPHGVHEAHKKLAETMRERILTDAGARTFALDPAVLSAIESASSYEPIQGLGLYGSKPTTGASPDYAFSRHLFDPTRPLTYSFVLELRGDLDGFKFHPAYKTTLGPPATVAQYPKLERECHSALAALLKYVATWTPPVIAPPPPPPAKSKGSCLISTAVLGSFAVSYVVFLRSLRDEELNSTPVGRLLVAVLNRVYRSFSGPLARRIADRPVARCSVRLFAVVPIVAFLHAVVAVTGAITNRTIRVAIRSAAIVVFCVAAVATVAAVLALALSAGVESF